MSSVQSTYLLHGHLLWQVHRLVALILRNFLAPVRPLLVALVQAVCPGAHVVPGVGRELEVSHDGHVVRVARLDLALRTGAEPSWHGCRRHTAGCSGSVDGELVWHLSLPWPSVAMHAGFATKVPLGRVTATHMGTETRLMKLATHA